MKWFWIICWTYLIFVLHSGFARELAICGYAPHLVLTGLVLMTVRTGGRQGVFFAAVWGLLLDCLGDGQLGGNLVALTLAALAVQSVHARWPSNSLWRAGVLASLVVGIEFGVSTVPRILTGGVGPDLRVTVTHAAGSALYSGLVIAVLLRASQMVLRQPAIAAGAIAPSVSNKWRMLTEV